jgi:hypothetical protein
MKKILIRLLVFVALFAAFVGVLGRGPNFTLDWKREVPSKETIAAISVGFRDTRNWPVFHHALKSVSLFENGKPVEGFERVVPGMVAVFVIEPKDKEWKRFEIKAQVLPPNPGEAFRFRMLEESSGKTTRLLDGVEWWVGVRPATEAERESGNLSYTFGGATAVTKTSRARFLGRLSPKILMNQIYPVDLVRLANFTANMESWAKESDPVYR